MYSSNNASRLTWRNRRGTPRAPAQLFQGARFTPRRQRAHQTPEPGIGPAVILQHRLLTARPDQQHVRARTAALAEGFHRMGAQILEAEIFERRHARMIANRDS
jgi:hypothetical protein